ncbi:MAG: hypothetical protein R3B84_00120 [Zavarzinella sp.]
MQTHRAILPILPVFCILLLAAGCNLFDPLRERGKAPPPVPSNKEIPTAQELVKYLNDQASVFETIDTRDLSITGNLQGNSGSIEGTLVAQKPRNLNLVARKPILGPMAYIGSNSERFWFHFPKDGSNSIFYCSYADFERGLELPLPVPIDPDWILESFGMLAPNPNGDFRTEQRKDTIDLIEETTYRGQKVRKVTTFYLGNATGGQPQIPTRTMYDASNRIISQAKITRVKEFPVRSRDGSRDKVLLCPQEMELSWPNQETSISLDLGRMQVNVPVSRTQFEMPDLGVKAVDLRRAQPASRTRRTGASFQD